MKARMQRCRPGFVVSEGMSKQPRLKALAPRIAPAKPRLAVQSHAGPERDKVRSASVPWRQWYKTARWRQLRLRVFERDLFTCQWPGCGRVTGEPSQLVCDHVRPHRGDEALFWDEGNLQTLCKPCHDSAKQREERRAIR